MKILGIGAASNKNRMVSLKHSGANNVAIFPNKKTDQNSVTSFKGNPSVSPQMALMHTNPNSIKYIKDFYDIPLLNLTEVSMRNNGVYTAALKEIEEVGLKKLTSKSQITPLDKEHPNVWSVTSEFAPIKEGGLGSVPPEVRNNAERLGVNMPTFIPMYLNEGSATLSKIGDKYTYRFKKDDNCMSLDKVATIKMDVYRNGKSETIPVNFFLHTDKDKDGNERQLIFIQTDNYFDGTIYEGSSKSEEPEKFAIMSKAVYEFAKLKMDGINAAKNVEIHSEEAFSAIKEPDAMILNDWQASPTAALLRYKSVMENAHGQLSDKTTQKLKDMRVITIAHNAMYQGSTQNDNDFLQKKTATANILNTLFDKYAYDIVSHAKSGAAIIDPNDRNLRALDNVLVLRHRDAIENYTNFLNMGIILSDYLCPVSENYAQELVSPQHWDLSNMLQWALVQKQKAGRLIGIINGNDYANLNIEAKAKGIKKGTGVTFETYNTQSSTEEIMQKRMQNKLNFYNKFVLPFAKSNASSKELKNSVGNLTKGIEFCQGSQGTTLPILSEEELRNTPILMSGGRLVSQKGIDVMCDAIKMLFDNWNHDFPGKNKPIFYIAGGDNEGGTQRKIIENLKGNKLSKEDNNRILFAHGRVPMAAFMAASDYFLMPSKFEPCGLTQGESLALATPVIASAVGGIVDTINRDYKLNGILTKKEDKLTAKAFYEAMKKGLNIYYNNQDDYACMVKDAIDEDFSWSKDGKGPVHDYLHLLGIQK